MFSVTNLDGARVAKHLDDVTQRLGGVFRKLGSGLRITRAADDASGLGQSEKLDSLRISLGAARRNANDGVSVLQTAEGALSEISDLLKRMRELSVQAASESLSTDERGFLSSEFTQAKSEITRIANTATFNGINLLDGSFSNKRIQIDTGTSASSNLSLTMGGARATDLAATAGTSTTTYYAHTAASNGTITTAVTPAASMPNNNVVAQTLTIDGTGSGSLSDTASITLGGSAASIATLVNAKTGTTGVSATASTTASFKITGAGTVGFWLMGSGSSYINVAVADANNPWELAGAITTASGTTGVTVEGMDGDRIDLKQSSGYDIRIETFTTTAPIMTGAGLAGATGSTAWMDGGNASQDSTTVGGVVTFTKTGGFTLSTNSVGSFLASASVSSTGAAPSVSTTPGTSLDDVSISTLSGARSALDSIDTAQGEINSIRSTVGASQNRLTAALALNDSTSQALTTAKSRISDSDVAQDTAENAKFQMLQQASAAVWSQTGRVTQAIANLLR